MSVYLVLVVLATGGVLTSFAEYHFQYNLVDYILKGYRAVAGLLKKL